MFPIHTHEHYPPESKTHPSIFLVGPTPRDRKTVSWRPEAIQLLESLDFKGYVFVPESDWGITDDDDASKAEDLDKELVARAYNHQVDWEREGLEAATVIAAWVPRELKSMPAFTTNVEFGRYVTSGRLLYGRPDGAPKTSYLDWLYRLETGKEPFSDLKLLMARAVKIANANYFCPGQ